MNELQHLVRKTFPDTRLIIVNMQVLSIIEKGVFPCNKATQFLVLLSIYCESLSDIDNTISLWSGTWTLAESFDLYILVTKRVCTRKLSSCLISCTSSSRQGIGS